MENLNALFAHLMANIDKFNKSTHRWEWTVEDVDYLALQDSNIVAGTIGKKIVVHYDEYATMYRGQPPLTLMLESYHYKKTEHWWGEYIFGKELQKVEGVPSRWLFQDYSHDTFPKRQGNLQWSDGQNGHNRGTGDWKAVLLITSQDSHETNHQLTQLVNRLRGSNADHQCSKVMEWIKS